jgi:hypothetical protein
VTTAALLCVRPVVRRVRAAAAESSPTPQAGSSRAASSTTEGQLEGSGSQQARGHMACIDAVSDALHTSVS